MDLRTRTGYKLREKKTTELCNVDSTINKWETYQYKCIFTWSIFIAVVFESVWRLDFSR